MEADELDGEPGGTSVGRRRGQRALPGVAVAAVALVIALLAWQLSEADGGRAIRGAIAAGERPRPPDFELPRIDQQGTLRLSALRGEAVILNFWASWCEPCNEEAPLLERAWQRYRNDGVVVLGVNSADLTSDAREFIRRHGLTFPNVRDGAGRAKSEFGLIGYPQTFFLDRAGRLVSHVAGVIDEQALERGIRAALGRSPERD